MALNQETLRKKNGGTIKVPPFFFLQRWHWITHEGWYAIEIVLNYL